MPHVLSVQVGRPRTVGIPDAEDPMQRPFTSAIWKRPVEGPVEVGPLGLRGDAVANTRVHGGPDQALLIYAASHYPLWREEWGREELGPGDFGENLTVVGMTEDDACIGDVLQIGSASFQVSHPRTPCAKLARRHQMPDMIAQVQRNGRSGWYLRVLAEGDVEAGQSVRLVDRPCPDWSVRRAAVAMLERKERPDIARVLARCPALSRDWRDRLSKI
jgi:MOSC domain-containing protein YiiM